jgi:organic hydroperoxide reductase OsmC/OhrA
MVHEHPVKLSIKLERDMLLKWLPSTNIQGFIIDESIDDQVKKIGPDAASLLGLAVSSCLSASLLFCLEKKNLSLDDLLGEVEVSFKKNEKGYIRIDKVKVNLTPKADDPSALKRLEQCTKRLKNGNMLFEESCIITPSVIEGIDVEVQVNL